MTTKFVGTKELRQDMAKIAKNAEKKRERIIVMRKNQPIFELKPLNSDEALIESFRRDIEEARTDARKGDVYTQEEVMRELGL
jgi:PHD/YefM family antitoxin component YafN of YafNO toxin-antitoxin module